MSKILGPGRRGNRTEIRRMSQNLVILAREKWMLGRMGPKGRLVPSVHLFSIKFTSVITHTFFGNSVFILCKKTR